METKGIAIVSSSITWLPHIVPVDGVWEEILSRLYAIFSKDFINSKVSLNRIEVWYDRRKIDGNYEEGFWHVVTREEKRTRERIFDPRRSERLPWCAPLIQNNADENVKFWRYREGNGKIRFYIWLYALNYVVILEERTLQPIGEKPARVIAMLVTAFYVDTPYKNDDLERKYTSREV